MIAEDAVREMEEFEDFPGEFRNSVSEIAMNLRRFYEQESDEVPEIAIVFQLALARAKSEMVVRAGERLVGRIGLHWYFDQYRDFLGQNIPIQARGTIAFYRFIQRALAKRLREARSAGGSKRPRLG